MRRPLVILLAALAAVLAVGCGEHKIEPPPPAIATGAVTAGQPAAATATGVAAPAAPAAALLVTEDFGRKTRTDRAVSPDQSVLDALRSVSEVQTTYGGRYVQAIDGLEGSLERARDWLFFVNGVESPVGAAEVDVHEGDHVWWDFRRWRGYLHVPAVVGAWPEPFLHGTGGEPPDVSADPPLDAALEAAGARLVEHSDAYRVVVGADSDLRQREPAWRRAAAQPRREGLTVWLQDGAVRVWNATAGRAETVPGARAIAVAVRESLDPPGGFVLVVAGTDAAAAQAAAQRIADDPAALQRHYARAFGAAGEPVASGGTGLGA